MRDDVGAARQVRHAVLGLGTVLVDSGQTVVVRFGKGIHEVEYSSLSEIRTVRERAGDPQWDCPGWTMARLQAEAIASVNARWGVFSWTRIQLLPHQLWVVRKVTERLPMRWLIADDVGLGKTIEAGMIVQSLVARGLVQRLLVLCPASLVGQWRYRLREMFDVRLAEYAAAADRPGASFWDGAAFVVGSIQTLRRSERDRKKRLLEAEPWDLVVVDEAHHLRAEGGEATLGYRLVRDLLAAKKVRSLLFFTGTPHRGSDEAFVGLLELLRPDLFRASGGLSAQLGQVREAVIRNNKAAVTDMRGRKLFRPLAVSAETYSYSEEEAAFYELLTEFIETGRAYATSLDAMLGRAVVFVLLAMQKLASSSVAAIRQAILRRRERLLKGLPAGWEGAKDVLAAAAAGATEDGGSAAAEEVVVTLGLSLALMNGELPALDGLLEAADAVRDETKIRRLMEIVDGRFKGRSVLLFTEYKATQAAVVGELMRAYGPTAVVFINGDDVLPGVAWPTGGRRDLRMQREDAARKFNAGEAQFLVSTEAGGEGIDLQERCYTLIHIDLPWNPMRLHQRTGRIYRFGQTERVEVVSLRNPDTVEGRIWELLEEKLARINKALSGAMDEPEDLSALVLGMSGARGFDDLFAEGGIRRPDDVDAVFRARTAELGSEEGLAAVRDLLGSMARFDFSEVAGELPEVGLSDLRPFMEVSLALEGRKLIEDGEEVSFITPEAWLDDVAVRREYRKMHFDRSRRGYGDFSKLIGVGLAVFDRAVRAASDRPEVLASVPRADLSCPLIGFRIRDRVTDGVIKRETIVGVEWCEGEAPHMLADWTLLKRLNALPSRRRSFSEPSPSAQAPMSVEAIVDQATAWLWEHMSETGHDGQHPVVDVVAVLFPAEAEVVCSR